MKKTYYHATKKENVLKIIHKDGLKADFMGLVYLSDTVEGALEFMKARKDPGIYAVIPVYVDEEKITESFDHNPEYIKANAFTHAGSIPVSNIERDLTNIPLFKLSMKKKRNEG